MTLDFGALTRACEAIGLSPERAWLPAIEVHLRLLEKWSEKMNLTSVKEPQDALVRHIVDSLALLRLNALAAVRGPVLDVGSGAGFPGIPLAIARPDWTFTLLEPRQKRGIFLDRVVAEAGLKNARWREGRLPDAALNGRFNLVVSRATLAPDELLVAATPTLAPGGIVAVMAAEAPWTAAPDGFQDLEAHHFELGGARRYVGCVRLAE
ncbi:MAG: 16S rRNA (guanine(527)-N(7))-methyltransferase RsmG [Myxococcales bacterium]|nr:16S rRNA (guanine(527)-N(7))-methyltransferase RsmG [Myxococcales bacterium]